MPRKGTGNEGWWLGKGTGSTGEGTGSTGKGTRVVDRVKRVGRGRVIKVG